MLLFELKQKREAALSKADGILKAAEEGKRILTTAENEQVDSCMAEVNAVTPQIQRIESLNTLRAQFPTGRVIADVKPGHAARLNKLGKKFFSEQYFEDFFSYVTERKISAALSEGTNTAGGFAVPSIVDGQIVPLAPAEMGIRTLADVIPTSMDIKFPRQTSHAVAAVKAEAAAFVESDPAIDQFTLSAFMVGVLFDISWELTQDVPAFLSFLQNDGILGLQEKEEALFATGTGTGQAQGLSGNVGVGTTQALSINGTLDLLGSLNAAYHSNASWLMQRATSIAIRKLQVGANLFEPVFTRVGNQDYLHGYPVAYSQAMPANGAAGTKPIQFGDFKRGYLIGDRGGNGISVKFLDQTKAVNGLLEVLIYRRSDGRVRRSEAIQEYVIA
jgi:HK97 family phage major capsid protein